MYRDNSNVLFKIEFLYVTADCKKKHGKKNTLLYCSCKTEWMQKSSDFLYNTNTACILPLHFIN